MTVLLAWPIDTHVVSEMIRMRPESRLDDFLEDLLKNRIVDRSKVDARAYARIMGERRRCGDPMNDHAFDACLVVAAACYVLVVVTRNVRRFGNAGFEIVDPWTFENW